jgi:TRAP-type uncharacterized transport system substrate-binding protein
MTEHPPYDFPPPVFIRSRLALEVAAELVGTAEWPYLRAHVDLRARDFDSEGFSIFGTGSPDGIDLVGSGDVAMAMINPSAMLTMAYRGKGPYAKPIDVRAITVSPSYDQIALGVLESTGITSFDDIAAQHYPLRVSVRGPRENSVPLVANEMCKAHGFTLDDIVAWGGTVDYERPLPWARIPRIAKGEIDAIFDEAVKQWADEAPGLGMRLLDLSEDALTKLEAIGLRRGVIAKSTFPNLPADVLTLDFSGFPVFTHASVPDAQIRAVCQALEARKALIPWEGQGPMPLNEGCRDTPAGPLDVPLHPAAEAYWREQGYL